MRSHEDRQAVIVTRLAAMAALGVAVALPAVYFWAGFRSLAAAVETKAEIKAEAVTQVITALPQLWTFQEYRLTELLSRHPVSVSHEMATILDADGNVVVRVGEPAPAPVLRRSHALYDAGRVVGRIEIVHSLRDEIAATAVAALLAALLGAAAFLALRVLPLRALGRVTDALYAEKERAEVTLHSIGDGVVTTDAEARIVYMNPMAEQLTGWPRADAAGRPVAEVLPLIDENTLAPAQNPLHQALAGNRITSFSENTALIRRDQSSVAIEDSAAPIHDRDGRVIGGVLVFHDVSAARSMAQRLSWAATHDALTGLVNRREFETRVEAVLAGARNSGQVHALCYMDLDQFKVVNDTSGHEAGDELLRQLAMLLQSKVRASDTLARLGGDEFGTLLDGCPLDRAQLIAADLLATVRDFRFNWKDKVFTVGVSIGLVSITGESSNRADVLSAADAACYAAKEQGRNRVYVFRSADQDIAQRRGEMNWVARINRALEENRFALYHQSYRALGSGAAPGTHIEVLLRMIDEDGALVLPGSFLPAAERYNLMPLIDRWVIETVFSLYASLLPRFGGGPLTCAINVSGTSLNAEGFVEFIRQQAGKYALPPHSVCFEITETAAINNLRRAARFMEEIRSMGFLFALDDFGSGTSSFGYLKSLPVDYLKIDGGFVKDLVDDPLDKAMTETINRIGHIMGVRTVAEFAENSAIIGELESMGVDFAQGYGVAVPAPLIGPSPRTGQVATPEVSVQP